MNKNGILCILLVIVTALTYYGCKRGLGPNSIEINEDVYMVKDGNSYSISCTDCRLGSERIEGTIAVRVDSIIISYKYGTLIHGTSPASKKKKWFYIDVSQIKNVYDDFTRIDEATSSTMGESYIDSVMTPKQVWKKYSQ